MRISVFSHDRSERLEISVKELYDFIEDFADQSVLKGWYSWFEKHFSIPEVVVKQYFKRELAEQFDFVRTRTFGRKLLPLGILPGIGIYLGAILWIAINRGSRRKRDKTADLLLVHTEDVPALKRFERLIRLFGSSNVLIVVPNRESITFPGATVLHRPRFMNYRLDFKELLVVLRSVVFHMFFSVKAGVNLTYMSGKILDSIFYYRTLFEEIDAKYLLGFQHYHTNAIANYIFKGAGGITTAYMQKNIGPSLGRNSFYYDMDCFFTLGRMTGKRANELGARIDEVVPIGSFFMESELLKEDLFKRALIWDVINIGGNALFPGTYMDIYNAHNEDYLEHLTWLKQASIDYPSLRIGFKPHPGDRTSLPPYEEDFLADSNVELIGDSLTSYQVCFQSKLIVSWASTMVVEMYGHGRSAFFLDPGGRNDQFISKEIANVGMFLTSYEEFVEAIFKNLEKLNGNYTLPESDSLCLRSHKVSQRIYDHLFSSDTRHRHLQ